MKERDELINFFNKRLVDTKPTEEDWNVPSEDIWLAAKKEFPKKKKRRFPFLLFFFSATAIALVTMFYFLTPNSNTTGASNAEANSTSISTSKTSTTLNEASTAVQDSKRPVVNEEAKNDKKSTLVNNNPEQSKIKKSGAKQAEVAVKAAPVTEKIAEKAAITNKDVEKQGQLRTADTKNASIVRNALPPSTISEEKIIEEAVVSPSQPVEGESKSMNENQVNTTPMAETSSLIDIPKASTPVADKISESARQVVNLSTLSLNGIQNFELAEQELKLNSSLTPKMKKRWKPNNVPTRSMEIGVSHSPFVINPFTLSDSDMDLEENESYDLTSRYRNINLNFSKRIARRWSFSSGVMLSDLKINLAFANSEVLDNNSLEDVDANINNTIVAGSLDINDAETQVAINLEPGVELMATDRLDYEGDVPIRLQVAQIPFIMNYHMGRNKLQWMLHGGMSLDFLTAELGDLRIDVYRDNELISRGVEYDDLKTFDIGLSIYVGGGLKYYFKDNLNIGASLKIDVAGLLFSRYDLGVYHTF